MASMATDGTVWAVDTSQNALQWQWRTADRRRRPANGKNFGRLVQPDLGIDATGQPVKLQTNHLGEPGRDVPRCDQCRGRRRGLGCRQIEHAGAMECTGWDVMPGQATQIAVGSQSIVWSVDPKEICKAGVAPDGKPPPPPGPGAMR
jgi:hypothetical protein